MVSKSNMHETFTFLTKLAWKNRITIPVLVCVAFLSLNFRWEIEISIQTERIEFQENVQNNQSDGSDMSTITDDEEFDVVTTEDDESDFTIQ